MPPTPTRGFSQGSHRSPPRPPRRFPKDTEHQDAWEALDRQFLGAPRPLPALVTHLVGRGRSGRGWGTSWGPGGVTGGVHPLTGAFSESSSSSLVKRLKQSWSDTFPPAKLFWRATGSGGNLGGSEGFLGVGGLRPTLYLWDGQREVAEHLEGGGAVAAGLALEAALQLPHKEIWGAKRGSGGAPPEVLGSRGGGDTPIPSAHPRSCCPPSPGSASTSGWRVRRRCRGGDTGGGGGVSCPQNRGSPSLPALPPLT